jgi:hypothetical protein
MLTHICIERLEDRDHLEYRRSRSGGMVFWEWTDFLWLRLWNCGGVYETIIIKFQEGLWCRVM